MSRYRLIDSGKFAEVVFGWDPGTDAFFLQCFQENVLGDDDDENEGPAVWLSGLSMDKLCEAFETYGLTLPRVVQRVLEADACEQPFDLREGEPALWRGVPGCEPVACTVTERLETMATVRFPNGEERLCLMARLALDWAAAGIE